MKHLTTQMIVQVRIPVVKNLYFSHFIFRTIFSKTHHMHLSLFFYQSREGRKSFFPKKITYMGMRINGKVNKPKCILAGKNCNLTLPLLRGQSFFV